MSTDGLLCSLPARGISVMASSSTESCSKAPLRHSYGSYVVSRMRWIIIEQCVTYQIIMMVHKTLHCSTIPRDQLRCTIHTEIWDVCPLIKGHFIWCSSMGLGHSEFMVPSWCLQCVQASKDKLKTSLYIHAFVWQDNLYLDTTLHVIIVQCLFALSIIVCFYELCYI